MRTSDFEYDLPPELIAQEPVEPRDHSRMMVVNRATGDIEHRHFYDLPQHLRPGDVLVLNDTRVLRARLYGRREGTGGRVEVLLLRRQGPGLWHALGRPGRALKTGSRLWLEETLSAQVVGVNDDGSRLLRLEDEAALEGVGQVALPPYVHRPLEDPGRYQTVFARAEGSVAAPTAGLHFTPELLERLRQMGVQLAYVTLHVGLDTFRPVQAEDPRDHKLHSEWYELREEAATLINAARREGRRVVCAGTTTVRLVEQAALLSGGGELRPGSGWADLLILPGHTFRVVDVLLTNFHLPRSTLLMLVSAFACQGPSTLRAGPSAEGQGLVLRAYREAVAQRYRFYSFGDCMLIL